MSTTIAATVTVLIGMFVLGLTIALGTWVLSWSDHVKKQLVAKVYFKTDATARQIDHVRILLAKDSDVKSYTFVSKEAALAQMRRQYPDLVRNLSYNPLPASYEVVPVRAELNASIAKYLNHASNGLPPPGLDKVNYGAKLSKRVLRVGSIIEIVFLIGVLILLVASTLLIANTIRLSIFSRRREIEVMKLVGATNWFVRGPFMVEGLLCGLAGAVAAVFLLLLGKAIALPAILGHIKDSQGVTAMPFGLNALILLAAGLMLGAMGSGLTLRRFLKV